MIDENPQKASKHCRPFLYLPKPGLGSQNHLPNMCWCFKWINLQIHRSIRHNHDQPPLIAIIRRVWPDLSYIFLFTFCHLALLHLKSSRNRVGQVLVLYEFRDNAEPKMHCRGKRGLDTPDCSFYRHSAPSYNASADHLYPYKFHTKSCPSSDPSSFSRASCKRHIDNAAFCSAN